jgi:shikimate dehydrogenase
VSYKLGLIGYPVEHSLSPRMHHAALSTLALGGDYTALAVAPECLRDTLPALVAQGYQGLNVTIPHKQAIMPLLDELSDSARAIGAVNTIVVERGKLIGHNTDAFGFMRGLERVGFDARDKSALVIGAGGAARSVVYALRQTGARVTIWNRTRARAEQLASDFGATVATYLSPPSRCGAYDLIVNTTSVGMSPHHADSPVHLLGRGFGAKVVYDLVYYPRETALLHEAHQIGARAISGLEMLAWQGAEAFRLWTGYDAPVDIMLKAIV